MKLNNQNTAAFCRGLAVLLHAGVGLADGLFLLAKEQTGPMQALSEQLGKQLDMGGMLSDAMEESGAFSVHASAMVRVGEQTGRVEEALQAMADFYEERHRTGRRVKNALAYPSLILLLMLVVVAVLLIKVLPVFDSVYASLGSRLTGVAAGLLYLGQLLKQAMPVLFALLALAVAGVLLYCLWGGFREKLTGIYRRYFADKGVFRRFNNANFAQALAMGVGSGMPLDEAVALAKLLLADIPGAAARCQACADALQAGESLPDAMDAGQLLPAAESRLLAVGIRGGNSDQIMADIARRMMEQANEHLEDAVSKVEPAMVLMASLLVGMILLSVMLPLMNIMSTIG